MLHHLVSSVASWVVPMFLFIVLVHAAFKKVHIFDTFITGAQEGFSTSVRLIPYLVAMLVGIGILRSSGALDLFISLLTPVLALFNVPSDVVPLAIMRPLSGSGALGITAELLESHGPDSLIGRIASTMQGSTDTTLFVLTVYFGSVGIRRARHALLVGLLADLTGFAVAIAVCIYVFS